MNGFLATRLPSRHCCAALLAACTLLATPLGAQETDRVEPAGGPSLPSVADLAHAMASPGQHAEALVTMGTLAWVEARLDDGSIGSAAALGSFAEDRDWLERLYRRWGGTPLRSPVLDTAAWQVILLLEQHALAPRFLGSPQSGALDLFVAESFNRSQPAAAFAAVPVLNWHLESDATLIWQRLLERAAQSPELAMALAGLSATGFAAWQAPGDPPEFGAAADVIAGARVAIARFVGEVADAGPPDYRRVREAREALLATLPTLDPGDRIVARGLLHLARLVPGLPEQHHFALAEALLAVVAELDQAGDAWPVEVRAQAEWISDWLPTLSSAFAREFATVDPRINSTVATVYDVARALARESEVPPGSGGHRKQLADAVARLAMLVPDMAYYFDVPVRDPIAGGVDACTGIVASTEEGRMSLDRAVFDDCQETLVGLADNEARESQLSGDVDGPFSTDTLERELELTPGQRINYGIGYLHDRYTTGCAPPERALPNPLEWAYLATFMAWFSEQAPVYFQTPENERRLLRMREIGQELVRVTAEQVDCIAGAGAGVNDPVMRVLEDYRQQLRTLGRSLQDAVRRFRASVLAPGADIALESGARQSTAYRPDDLAIGPCDPEQICEMNGELRSTRALLGLFPEPFLVADQSGMGELQICYDRVEWVDRRSEPVRAGDRNVANYYGHLAFDLRGRYRADDEVTDLFAFRFRSPDEYHYMFSAAKDEVLADSCPVEWIGSKIVTPLAERRLGIVPDRLTYLSASRTLPSRLFRDNWETGSEWRDWFVTGIGVDTLDVPDEPDITARLDEWLNALFRREQRALYGQLLAPPTANSGSDPALYGEASRLSTDKALLRMQLMLFYPDALYKSDTLRSAVVGNNGLLDQEVLQRFQAANTPVPGVLDAGFDRLDRFEAQWQALPEALRRNGTVVRSVLQAMMRLDALYERNFAVQVLLEELPAAPISAPPAEESQ